jgi:hypothetical protein
MKRSWLAAVLGVVLSLVGCDAQRISELEEGLSTEADVRARFGEPLAVWDASDMAGLPNAGPAAQPGAKTLEYTRQPNGHVNYFITIGPDGKMSALRQTLTETNFQRVTPGMRMEEVRKMLGKPMKVTTYALKQETHYDWRYLSDPTTSKIFTAVFDPELRVARTGYADDIRPASDGSQR